MSHPRRIFEQFKEGQIMTIDEAIKHVREVANQGCIECNQEHEQLAEWLEGLKTCKVALKLACEIISVYEIQSEELKIYKKALELMANHCCNPYIGSTKADIIDYYLREARED